MATDDKHRVSYLDGSGAEDVAPMTPEPAPAKVESFAVPEVTSPSLPTLPDPAAPERPFEMPEPSQVTPLPVLAPPGAVPVAFAMPEATEPRAMPDAAAFEGPRPQEVPIGPEARAPREQGTLAPVVLAAQEGGVARAAQAAGGLAEAAKDAAVDTAIGVAERGVGALGFLAAVPASLLPAPWRRRLAAHLPLVPATVASGIVESGVAVVGGGFAFAGFRERLMEAGLEGAVREVSTLPATYPTLGFAPFLLFLLSPVGLASLYFLGEGLVRAFAAAGTGEAVGSLPLWLAEKIWSWLRAEASERAQGARIPDEVALGGRGFDLRIASCRERGWDKLVTLEYRERQYRLVKYQRADGPRPHVYLFRRALAGDLIRKLVRYTEEDVLGR